jgi:transcriptional regulator with XRE-family HTH domain
MKELLKTAREQKNIKTRELARLLHIDQALISKFENGNRMPTKEQVFKLAEALNIDYQTLLTSWLKEKVLEQIATFDCGPKALKMALDELKSHKSSLNIHSSTIESLIKDITLLKTQIKRKQNSEQFHPTKKDDVYCIFHVLQWNQHSFTMDEIEKYTQTKTQISGKSMKEHLEVNNAKEVLRYLHLLIDQKFDLNESEILTIHQLLLKNINSNEGGIYRKTPLFSSHFNIQSASSNEIESEVNELFEWYEKQKSSIHPIELATSMYLKFLAIQPFSESNEKIASLIFTFILWKKSYGLITAEMNVFSKNIVEYAIHHQDYSEFYLEVLKYVQNYLENIIDS